MAQHILILITASAWHKNMYYALKLAQSCLKKQQKVSVFFYQDAVSIANQLNWQADDQINLQQAWQELAIDLPVCVSASLTRGICDDDNAQRHHLTQANLAHGFQLVGLGVLSDLMIQADKVVQF